MQNVSATYLNLEAVHQRAGRSIVLLRRWCVKGTVPAIKIKGEWMIDDRFLPYIQGLPRRRRKDKTT